MLASYSLKWATSHESQQVSSEPDTTVLFKELWPCTEEEVSDHHHQRELVPVNLFWWILSISQSCTQVVPVHHHWNIIAFAEPIATIQNNAYSPHMKLVLVPGTIHRYVFLFTCSTQGQLNGGFSCSYPIGLAAGHCKPHSPKLQPLIIQSAGNPSQSEWHGDSDASYLDSCNLCNTTALSSSFEGWPNPPCLTWAHYATSAALIASRKGWSSPP